MNFEREAALFRVAVRRAGSRGAGRKYPAAVREQGAAYFAARRAAGAPESAVMRELGVRRATLLGWVGQAKAAQRPRFVPVSVGETTGRIVVHGPGGVRVEGLDVAGVTDLFRRLG
jgi:hypothetical protein